MNMNDNPVLIEKLKTLEQLKEYEPLRFVKIINDVTRSQHPEDYVLNNVQLNYDDCSNILDQLKAKIGGLR